LVSLYEENEKTTFMIEISQDITYDDLVNQLDLNENDVLLISSDINKLAKYYKRKGGFDAVKFIASFQSKLSNGTLLIPAFTDYLKNGDTFDYYTSKPSTGALSNRCSKLVGFKRTKDPLHSFYVWGKDSEELVSMNSDSTFGKNSAFGFLYQKNAKLLLIDVDFQNSLTFIHFIEESLKVNYRKPYLININCISKEIVFDKQTFFYTKKIGVETDLSHFESNVKSSKVSTVYKTASSELCLLEAQSLYNFTDEYLKGNGKLHSFSIKKFLRQLIKAILGYKQPID